MYSSIRISAWERQQTCAVTNRALIKTGLNRDTDHTIKETLAPG